MFQAGTAWLAVFSLGCGFANNIVTMNILRGLQGLGPAAFIPASVSCEQSRLVLLMLTASEPS